MKKFFKVSIMLAAAMMLLVVGCQVADGPESQAALKLVA
jgi:hypothetical protein